jgi:GNAT superfamily N-acetyltransferase
MLPAGYEITSDKSRIDAVAAHAFLTNSYWAKGITLDQVQHSIDASRAFAIFCGREQVGMARVITDEVTYAYLTDVYVLEGHRGLGLSKALLDYILNQPELEGVLRWALFTKDAQSLYRQFGFFQYPMPERMMVIDKRLNTG